MTTSAYHRALLVFLDGVGLTPAKKTNPFSSNKTPGIDRFLGGPLITETIGIGGDRVLLALDATLGVEGLPQSATGQTALFTGVNAARQLGHHSTGLPGPKVRSIVEEGNLFHWAVERRLRTTFANAYTPRYLEAIESGRLKPSVTTSALLSAGLEPRGLDDLRAGRALSWDVRRDHFARQLDLNLPNVTPQEAGAHLGRIAADHDLTVYESFITDMTGHRRHGFDTLETLRTIDGLLAGLIDSLSEDTTVIVSSDHGNFEESDHKRHTRNPVPLMVLGPLAASFTGLESILEVTPKLLDSLGVRDGSRTSTR